MPKYDTQIGNLDLKYDFVVSIHPEDRESNKRGMLPEMRPRFCIVDSFRDMGECKFVLKRALCKQSPFSLMFVVKYGLVDPDFVIGLKKGNFVKFNPSQLNFPKEVYGGWGDNFYEGVSEAKDAYITLYRAYQEVASKYKIEPRISCDPIEPGEVISKVFDEIKKGTSRKDFMYNPVFVFVDFDYNTIYAFRKTRTHDYGWSCGFENKKFLQRFAAVYLEHNGGVLPSSFASFEPLSEKGRWMPPGMVSAPHDNHCVFGMCHWFRGYNPETRKVRCFAFRTGRYGRSYGEIDPRTCYEFERRNSVESPSVSNEIEEWRNVQ